jgi:hypothetical protein
MWETSRFKKSSGDGASGKGGGGGRRGGRGAMRMKRVQAELMANHGFGVPGLAIQARLILNDLGHKSATVFANQTLELGQLVTLTLEHPRPLVVRGKVTYNALFELSSRTYAKTRYPYRIQIEFDFLNDGEAQAVREYVEELLKSDLSKAA